MRARATSQRLGFKSPIFLSPNKHKQGAAAARSPSRVSEGGWRCHDGGDGEEEASSAHHVADTWEHLDITNLNCKITPLSHQFGSKPDQASTWYCNITNDITGTTGCQLAIHIGSDKRVGLDISGITADDCIKVKGVSSAQVEVERWVDV